MFFMYQRAKFSIPFTNRMMGNSQNASLMLYFINILLVATLLTHPFLPFMTPTAAAAPPQFSGFPTLLDFLSFKINVKHDLTESIALAGGEARQTLQEFHDHLETLIHTLSETYQDNLNVTIDSLDIFTRNKLLEVENLMVSINEEIQKDIRLISKEAQALVKLANEEIRTTIIQLERSISNVIIVGGETIAYVIDRALYNMIWMTILILLAVGVLLFILLLSIRGLPSGCLTRLIVLTFIATYIASLGSLLFVPNVRAHALTYTGDSLGKRLDKVISKPRIFDVRPDQIVLGETKEVEIWGSSLHMQSVTPVIQIGEHKVPVKATSDERIVIDVANLKAPEGSTNLVLSYDGLKEEEGQGGIVKAFCTVMKEKEDPGTMVEVLQVLCSTEEPEPELTPTPYEEGVVVKLLEPTAIPRKPADLVVKNLSFSPSSPKKGQNVTARTQVCNQGELAATGIKVYLKRDASYSKSYNNLSISSLNPGSCKDIRFDYPYSQKGQYNTQISVSSQSQDSNPNNNQQSKLVRVSPRIAQVTVSIDRIKLIQNHDDHGWPNDLEMYLWIRVNKGDWKRVPSRGYYQLDKGERAPIGYALPKINLEDDQLLKIEIEGWDADKDADDLVGKIYQEYELSGGTWTGGTYTKTGSSGNGSYEVRYTIQVDWQ